MGDDGCSEKSEVIPNVAGVTQDNDQRGASSYMVPSQLSPGSNDGGYCGRKRVHQQGENAYFDFMPVYKSITHMATGTDDGAKQCAKIVKTHMHACKKACMKAGGKDMPKKGGKGVASHPQTSNKMVPQRLKMATSPARGNKTRRWRSSSF